MFLLLVPLITGTFTTMILGVVVSFVDRLYPPSQNEKKNKNKTKFIRFLEKKKNSPVLGCYSERSISISNESTQLLPVDNQENNEFICQLSNQMLINPAELLCGHYFQKQILVQYVKREEKCPFCRQKTKIFDIFETPQLKQRLREAWEAKRIKQMERNRMIQDFGDEKIQRNCLYKIGSMREFEISQI